MKRYALFLLGISLSLSLLSACNSGFRLNGNALMTVEINTAFIDPLTNDPQATITGDVDITQIGIYTVTYTSIVNGKPKTLERIVRVVDTTPPIITLTGATHQATCAISRYQEEGFSATDNGDGDVSALVTMIRESQRILYRVSDRSGNLVEVERTFDLTDTTSPRLSILGPDHLEIPKGGHYHEFGVSAQDDCTGAETLRLTTIGSVNTKVLGEYLVTYRVSDEAGNTAETTRTIQIVDKPVTTVYLTFDDGPHTNTRDVLDILKDYKALATFFVVRRASKYNSYVTRAYNEGHTVALHSNTHNYWNIYASESAYFDDLFLVQDYVYELTGHRSWILRFPGGSSNTVSRFNPGIMTYLTQEVQRRGFHYFDWSVSTGDGNSANSAQSIVDRAIKYIKIGKSNVVLMHDGAGHTETVEALPAILEYLMSIGAVLLPITMDTPQSHHNVLN
jgi:peptidoglycan/xylan/chitin deacetylase (PgdA/CDA1 family)